MSIKDVILLLCANLEENLNDRDGENIHKVELVCEIKPSGYFLPQIHLGTSKTALLHNKEQEALFVELWLDNRCLFRNSNIPYKSDTEFLHMIEYHLLTDLLNTIFRFGVTAMDTPYY